MALDDKEKVMEKIVAESKKPREEIEKLIEQKKAKFSGLLTGTGAAFMVAKDLGIELDLERSLSERKTIAQLEDGMNNVDLSVEVKQIFSPKKFEKGGKKGELCNLIIADESGETRLTLWHRDVRRIKELKLEKGDKILLKNCYVTSYQDKPQLNLGYNGRIIIEKKGKVKPVKLDALKPGLDNVDAVGRITRMFERRKFAKEDRQGMVLGFELADGAGHIRVTAWNDLVLVVEKLNVGDLIKVEGAYTKEGLKGETELLLGWKSRVLKDPEIDFSVPSLEELTDLKRERVKISELKEGDSFKELNGIIVSVPRSPVSFKVCSKCRKKPQEIEGKFVCEACGEIEPEENLVFSFELDDGFGVIRCVAFGSLAEKILEGSAEKVFKALEEKGAEKFLEELRQKLTGKQLVVSGQAKKGLTEELEFIVKEILAINPLPEKEISEAMSELEKS